MIAISLGFFCEPAFDEVETAMSMLETSEQPPALVLFNPNTFGLQSSKTLPPEERLDTTFFASRGFHDKVADQSGWS